jgi:hypothetical protein
VKVGAENRKEVVIAAVLMFVALLLLARMALVDSGPSASAPTIDAVANAPVATRTSPRRLASASKNRTALTPSLDPRLRLDLLKSSEQVNYAGTGRNIFLAHEDAPIPKPVQSAKLDKQVPQQPIQPPPPPRINLKFFGFANKAGERRKVFLAKGDDVFIAGEGDIVDRRYKVVRIGPNSIEIQDVLNNQHQSIPITQG